MVTCAFVELNWLPLKRKVNSAERDKTSSAAWGSFPTAPPSPFSDDISLFWHVKDDTVSVPARFLGAIAGARVVDQPLQLGLEGVVHCPS